MLALILEWHLSLSSNVVYLASVSVYCIVVVFVAEKNKKETKATKKERNGKAQKERKKD
jgi:hypothetical protein